MLHSLKDLEAYTISASDGEIGRVKDFYFDDQAWVIRHLVVETGDWLESRKVLISPHAIQNPDWARKTLPVAITKGQVRHSPRIDTDKPISRQHESQHLGYYGYPLYWDASGFGGIQLAPALLPKSALVTQTDHNVRQQEDVDAIKAAQKPRRDDDPHLRSSTEVTEYHVLATDGEIGHISGFIVDEADWAIRYIIVNTSNWWLGHQVVIAPQWFMDVNWAERRVSIALNRQSVMDSPVFTTTEDLNREREAELYAHYQRVGYWPLEVVGKEAARSASAHGHP